MYFTIILDPFGKLYVCVLSHKVFVKIIDFVNVNVNVA